MLFSRFLPAIAAASLFCASAFATTVVVTTPAGIFTNPGPVNATGPGGPAYNTWYADNVRNSGSVGISSTYADSGNGSIQFFGPANAKADFEYNFSAPFLLSNLSALSYDYLRSGTSTAAAHLAPALRLYVSDGVHSGNLVYEPIYNGQSVSPTDTFLTESILKSYFWNSSASLDANQVYDRTLADWLALYPTLNVYQITAGIGSGWDGSFDGAVDNITYGVSGNSTTYNFETNAAPTPEPASMLLLSTGVVLTGVLWMRRRGLAASF